MTEQTQHFFHYMKLLWDCRRNWRLNISEPKKLYICTIIKSVKLGSSNNVCMGGFIFILLLLFSENALWFVVLFTVWLILWLVYLYSTWDSQVVPVQIV